VPRVWLALLLPIVEGCNLSTPTRFIPDASTSCPLVYTSTSPASVEDECTYDQCSAAFKQNGCNLNFVWRGCSMLPSHGVIDASGNVAFDPMPVVGACMGYAQPPMGSAAPPAFRMTCASSCAVDFYAPPFTSIATVRSIRVDGAAPILFAELGGDRLGGLSAFSGYISGAALFGDRLAVVSTKGTEYDPSCRSSVPNDVVMYDRATMEEVERTRAPSCLSHLVPDVNGGGFFGMYGALPWMIGRFDIHGNLVRSASVALPLTPMSIVDALALIASEDGTTLYAGYNVEPGTMGFIESFRTTDLTPVHSRVYTGGLHDLAMSDEGLLAAAFFESDEVDLFDPSTLMPKGGLLFPDRPAFTPTKAGALTLHRASSRLLVSATGSSPALFVFKNKTVESAGEFFESFGTAWRGTDWPLNRNLSVFGVTIIDSTSAARIARFDPVAGRFLPGSTEIGIGVVQELLEDADHDLWAILPWSATVARIHPTSE
jgi:hypothetical protein